MENKIKIYITGLLMVIIILGAYWFSIKSVIKNNDTKEEVMTENSEELSSSGEEEATNKKDVEKDEPEETKETKSNKNTDKPNQDSSAKNTKGQGDEIFKKLFADKSWSSNGNMTFSNSWGKENVESDGDYMKVKYPAGSTVPSNTPRGGAGFIYDIGKKYDKLSFSYTVKFEDGFDFVKGGKLPGLCGGACSRGGAGDENSFSTRFAWKRNGAVDILGYFVNSGENGEFLGQKDFEFKPNTEYLITQNVVLNDAGKNNGTIDILVNGEKVFSKTDITFRSSADTKIDSILFSTFFGGKDSSFAPNKDTFAYFKDFKIQENF